MDDAAGMHGQQADRERFGIYDNMIRLACGIENSADLIADLRQAIEIGLSK